MEGNGSRHGDLAKRSPSETFNLPKIWFDLYQLFHLAECNINWIILKSLLRTNAAAQNFQSTGQQWKTIPFHGASFNFFPFQFQGIMSRFPLLTHQLATAPSFAPGNRGTPPGWSSWSTWDQRVPVLQTPFFIVKLYFLDLVVKVYHGQVPYIYTSSSKAYGWFFDSSNAIQFIKLNFSLISPPFSPNLSTSSGTFLFFCVGNIPFQQHNPVIPPEDLEKYGSIWPRVFNCGIWKNL